MAVFVIAVARHSSIAVAVAIRSEWPFMQLRRTGRAPKCRPLLPCLARFRSDKPAPSSSARAFLCSLCYAAYAAASSKPVRSVDLVHHCTGAGIHQYHAVIGINITIPADRGSPSAGTASSSTLAGTLVRERSVLGRNGRIFFSVTYVLPDRDTLARSGQLQCQLRLSRWSARWQQSPKATLQQQSSKTSSSVSPKSLECDAAQRPREPYVPLVLGTSDWEKVATLSMRSN